MKGKCFSGANKGQRKESDFYETPYSMTQQLLDNWKYGPRKGDVILEPASGKGAIVKVLKKNGFNNILYYDINGNGKHKRDFLSPGKDSIDWIIANPPFSLAKEFIEHALQITRQSFALLLPLNYLHGEGRYNRVYKNGVLESVYVFTRFSMLGDKLRNDGKYKTGMIAYAWFVFNACNITRTPVIHWISNQEYILKAGEK